MVGGTTLRCNKRFSNWIDSIWINVKEKRRFTVVRARQTVVCAVWLPVCIVRGMITPRRTGMAKKTAGFAQDG